MSVLNALCGPLIIRGPLTFGPTEREEKRERRGSPTPPGKLGVDVDHA